MKNELPENAKMVFRGEIFEVWQWEQKMFDGTIEIFEKIKRADTVDVVAAVGNKIILTEQEQPHHGPFFAIPGGRNDKNEEPLSAAKRELLEETGYESSDWELFRERRPFGSIIWSSYTFIARDCRLVKDPSPDAGEKIKTLLVSFDEFIEISQKPDFRDKEFAQYLLRTKFDEKFREDLKVKLFVNEK